jgi:hypothetical protein
LLLAEIDAFLTAITWSDSYFGLQVCQDSRLVSRLRSGGTVTLETADRVRAFMAQHTPDDDGVNGTASALAGGEP